MNLQTDAKAPEARNTTWAGEPGEHLRSFLFRHEKSNLGPRDPRMPILQQAARTQKARRNGHYELRLVLSLFNRSIILRHWRE